MHTSVPAGVFWIDEDEILETDPGERLRLARHYMPLPAAFKEAAIALRALILEGARRMADGSDLLSQLHRTAAQENFLLAEPYVPGLGPAYNVASSIPRNVWEELPMPYQAIGYRELPLLNRADCNWMAVAWGEPTEHCSARVYHQATWDDCVVRYGWRR